MAVLAAALRVVPGNQLTLANSDLASVGTLQDIAVESRRAAQREKPMLWLPKLVAVICRVPTNDVDLEVRHLVHHGSACTPPTRLWERGSQNNIENKKNSKIKNLNFKTSTIILGH